jgi:tetratricopeptide (TPR) repeat protein
LDKALECFEKSIEFADKGGWLSMKSWAQFNSAEVLIYNGELDKAKELLDLSFKFLEQIGDKAGICGAYQTYGQLNRAKQDWDLAVLSYQQAIEVCTEINIPRTLASCKHELGMVYKEAGDKENAKEELRQSANLYTVLKLDNMVEKIGKELEDL